MGRIEADQHKTNNMPDYRDRLIRPDDRRWDFDTPEVMTKEQHMRYIANRMGVPLFGKVTAEVNIPIYGVINHYKLEINRWKADEIGFDMICRDNQRQETWFPMEIRCGYLRDEGISSDGDININPDENVWWFLDELLQNPLSNECIKKYEKNHFGRDVQFKIINMQALNNVIQEHFPGKFNQDILKNVLFGNIDLASSIPFQLAGWRLKHGIEDNIRLLFAASSDKYSFMLDALDADFSRGMISEDTYETGLMKELERYWDSLANVQKAISLIFEQALGDSDEPHVLVADMVHNLTGIKDSHIFSFDFSNLKGRIIDAIKNEKYPLREQGLRLCCDLLGKPTSEFDRLIDGGS